MTRKTTPPVFEVGDSGRYSSRFLKNTGQFTDSDGTHGWAKVVGVSTLGDNELVELQWPGGLKRKVIAVNLQRKGNKLRVHEDLDVASGYHGEVLIMNRECQTCGENIRTVERGRPAAMGPYPRVVCPGGHVQPEDRRYASYRRAFEAEPCGSYGLWVRPHLTRFGAENGFHPDPGFCKGAPGVVVRTQSETNSIALLRLGQDGFDDWLENLYPFPQEMP